MAESILSLSGIAKHYGNIPAAVDVTLDVHVGELLVLLGPSGCGKSTLLRLISGLETPDQGTISSNGRVLSDTSTLVPPEERKISLVFQDNALFPHMTGGDNVAFGLPKYESGTRARRVGEVLDMVRLTDVAGRYPH